MQVVCRLMRVASLVVDGVTFMVVSNGCRVDMVFVLRLLVVCSGGAVCDGLVRVCALITL